MIGLITLLLLMWKWMGLFLKQNHLLRCWDCRSLLNYIGTFTLSVLLKLRSRKLELWFVLRSIFLLRSLFISVNLPYSLVWNTVVMSVVMFLIATWVCWISYKNVYTGLLVLHLLLFLNCRYYFGRCWTELSELVPLPYSRGRPTRYTNSLQYLSVTFVDLIKMSV